MFELTPFEGSRRHGISMYNPFRDFEDFRRDLFGSSELSEFRTDIKDEGKNFLLQADLPGFKKEDIHVDVDGNYLTISAERRSDTDEKDKKGNFIRRERTYGSVSRSFDVSSIDTADISVSYNDGVLSLTLPKRDETLPSARRLEIK